MLDKKRWRFLLLTSLFLILFLPSVYALFESFLYYLTPDVFDIVQIYNDNRNTTHFLLFFFIISAAFRVFVSLWWGKEHENNLGYFYLAFGALGGLSIAYLFAQYGYTIENFGWFFLFGIMVLMFLAIFSWFKGNGENKGAFPWGLLIFLLILAFLFLPVMFPSISGLLSANELFNKLWPYLVLAGLVWLLISLVKSSFGGSGGSGGLGGSHGSSGGAPGFWSSMWERFKRRVAPGPYSAPGPKDRKIKDVTIKKIPDKLRYNLGERVVFKAEFSRKGYFGGSNIFEYEWFLGNVPIGSGPNMDRIDFTLTNAHFTQPDEEKEILVRVTDVANPTNFGIGRTKIRVISQPGEIIIKTNGNVVDSFNAIIGQDIELEYSISGIMPKSEISWAIIDGIHPPKISKKEFAKLTGLRRASRFGSLDQKVVKFKAGDNYLGKATMKPNKTYTIIAYAITSNIAPRFDALGNLIMGRVMFDVKDNPNQAGNGGQGSNTPGGGSNNNAGGNRSNRPSMVVYENDITSTPLISSSTDFKLNIYLGGLYHFVIENVDTSIYEVHFEKLRGFAKSEQLQLIPNVEGVNVTFDSAGNKVLRANILTKRTWKNPIIKTIGYIDAILIVGIRPQGQGGSNTPGGGQSNQTGNQQNNQNPNQGNNNPPTGDNIFIAVRMQNGNNNELYYNSDGEYNNVPINEIVYFIPKVAGKIKKPGHEIEVLAIKHSSDIFKYSKTSKDRVSVLRVIHPQQKKITFIFKKNGAFVKRIIITINTDQQPNPTSKTPTIIPTGAGASWAGSSSSSTNSSNNYNQRNSTPGIRVRISAPSNPLDLVYPQKGTINLESVVVNDLGRIVKEIRWVLIKASDLNPQQINELKNNNINLNNISSYKPKTIGIGQRTPLNLVSFIVGSYFIVPLPTREENGRVLICGTPDILILNLGNGPPMFNNQSTSNSQTSNNTQNFYDNFLVKITPRGQPNVTLYAAQKANSYNNVMNARLGDQLDIYPILPNGEKLEYCKILIESNLDGELVYPVENNGILKGELEINNPGTRIIKCEIRTKGFLGLLSKEIKTIFIDIEASSDVNPLDYTTAMQRSSDYINSLNKRELSATHKLYENPPQLQAGWNVKPQRNASTHVLPRQLNAVNPRNVPLRDRVQNKSDEENMIPSSGRTFTLGNDKLMFGLFDSNNLVTPLIESDKNYEYIYGEMNKNYLFKIVDENLDLNNYKLDFEIAGLDNNENFYESTDENNNFYAVLEARSPGKRLIACNIVDRFTGKVVKTLSITLIINPNYTGTQTRNKFSKIMSRKDKRR